MGGRGATPQRGAVGKEMSEWGRYTLALGMGSDAASRHVLPLVLLESKFLVLETEGEGVCASWVGCSWKREWERE